MFAGWESGFGPAFESAGQDCDILVAHLLHRHSGERGTCARGAHNDDSSGRVELLVVAGAARVGEELDQPSWRGYRAFDVAVLPFLGLAHVNEDSLSGGSFVGRGLRRDLFEL